MKTKLKIIRAIIYSSFFIASFSSCSKFLDKLPDNRAVIRTPDQVNLLLVSAYPKATYMLFNEALSDNTEDKGNSPDGLDPTSYILNTQMFKYQDANTNLGLDLPTTYWDSCYHAIAVANLALTYCNGADSNSYSAQKGEALICRAYAHFMLTVLFSKTYVPGGNNSSPGIPYIKTVQNKVFTTYDRGTVEEDYTNIEQDLVDGIGRIDESIYGTAPKFHFNVQAAHAFATRFYMFKGDYQKAIQHATAVFGSTTPASIIHNPVGDYNTLQYAQLGIKYTSSTQPFNLLLQDVESAWPGNFYGYRYGFGQGMLTKFFSSANVTGGTFGYYYQVYGATPQYYNIPKFYSNIISLFSTDEVLLNRAEAYVRTGNQTAALSDINAWVSKNVLNYTTTRNVTVAKATAFYGQSADSSLISTILRFKQVAYLEEGMRWFDILRLKIPVTHTSTDGYSTTLTADDNRRLLQIPDESASEGMQLNPR